MNFEKYLATANAFVNEVADELGIGDDRDRARRAVRAVLHALRARLTPEQSFHLLAQLPMLLKGVYVDGWKLSSTPDTAIRTEDELLWEVFDADGRAARGDFPQREDAREATIAVFAVLSRHISAGEMKHLRESMPRPLRHLMTEAEGQGRAAQHAIG